MSIVETSQADLEIFWNRYLPGITKIIGIYSKNVKDLGQS